MSSLQETKEALLLKKEIIALRAAGKTKDVEYYMQKLNKLSTHAQLHADSVHTEKEVEQKLAELEKTPETEEKVIEEDVCYGPEEESLF